MSGEAIDEVCDRIRALKRPIRCLTVEDCESDASLLEYELRPYNVTIDRAIDAASAVNALNHDRFDLIILDLTLKCPGNGIGVLKHIRSLPDHPPVVVLTGAGVHGEIYQQAMSIGVGCIMQKPMTKQQAALLFGTL